MSLVVNLEEFAELCGVTGETMRGHIRGVEDNPGWLIERGDRGRGYKIEAEGGLAWWRAKRDQAEAEATEHKEALAQLRLDILGDQTEDAEALLLSGKQRREEYAAVMDRIKVRRMMGELVEASELERHLTHAAVEARRRFGLIHSEYAAEAGLSPDDVAPLAALIERAVEEFVSSLTVQPGA